MVVSNTAATGAPPTK